MFYTTLSWETFADDSGSISWIGRLFSLRLSSAITSPDSEQVISSRCSKLLSASRLLEGTWSDTSVLLCALAFLDVLVSIRSACLKIINCFYSDRCITP